SPAAADAASAWSAPAPCGVVAGRVLVWPADVVGGGGGAGALFGDEPPQPVSAAAPKAASSAALGIRRLMGEAWAALPELLLNGTLFLAITRALVVHVTGWVLMTLCRLAGLALLVVRARLGLGLVLALALVV